MSESTAASSVTPVQPFEARHMAPSLTEAGTAAMRNVMTAVNGFYYPGDRSDAVASAVAWLQANPQACRDLNLGSIPTPPEGHR